MKILFVCTGNTCRSPMAEAIAKSVFEEKGIKAQISSAGISVIMALPVSQHAIDVSKSFGLDISEKTSKQITADDISEYDVILTMTNRHKAYLNLQVNTKLNTISNPTKEKIFTVYEFVENSNKDIDDPFGMDLEAYESCASELKILIEKLAMKIIELGGEPQ